MVSYLAWLPCHEKAKGRPRFGLKLVLHRLPENHPPRTRPTASPNYKPASPLCFSHMHDAWPPMHGLQARVVAPAASFHSFFFYCTCLSFPFLPFAWPYLASPLARFTNGDKIPVSSLKACQRPLQIFLPSPHLLLVNFCTTPRPLRHAHCTINFCKLFSPAGQETNRRHYMGNSYLLCTSRMSTYTRRLSRHQSAPATSLTASHRRQCAFTFGWLASSHGPAVLICFHASLGCKPSDLLFITCQSLFLSSLNATHIAS